MIVKYLGNVFWSCHAVVQKVCPVVVVVVPNVQTAAAAAAADGIRNQFYFTQLSLKCASALRCMMMIITMKGNERYMVPVKGLITRMYTMEYSIKPKCLVTYQAESVDSFGLGREREREREAERVCVMEHNYEHKQQRQYSNESETKVGVYAVFKV